MRETTIELRGMEADVRRRYQAVSENPRYGHYVRIPGRICKCLDYFKVDYERRMVWERLHSYYLFIGVVDDALDTEGLCAGAEILGWLRDGSPRLDAETKGSSAKLITEILKSHIEGDVYGAALTRLEDLYMAVARERQCGTMEQYIEARKRVGYLTAELSFLLIEPFVSGEHQMLHSFFTKVGEVGCLMDSVIDLRADKRDGVINFEPSISDHLHLTGRMLYEALRVFGKSPRLVGLFLEAASDDLQDRFRRPAIA